MAFKTVFLCLVSRPLFVITMGNKDVTLCGSLDEQMNFQIHCSVSIQGIFWTYINEILAKRQTTSNLGIFLSSANLNTPKAQFGFIKLIFLKPLPFWNPIRHIRYKAPSKNQFDVGLLIFIRPGPLYSIPIRHRQFCKFDQTFRICKLKKPCLDLFLLIPSSFRKFRFLNVFFVGEQ